MPKALSVSKHLLHSTMLMITVGLVATACNALPGSVISPITVIDAPANHAHLWEGDQVSVKSTSTDKSGIVRVDLKVDSHVVCMDLLAKSQSTAKIVQTWTATPGTHTITVRAVNISDVSSTPASIVISVAQVIEASPVQHLSSLLRQNLQPKRSP